MVLRYAVATGDWSATGTWNGGTLPAAGDDVHANGKTVTIDQNIVANSLKTVAGGSAVAGGSFKVASGTRTIDLQSLTVGSFTTGSPSWLMQVTGGNVTVTVANPITGDSSSAGNDPYAIRVDGGTVTVNGDVIGGAAGTTILCTSSGALTVYGDVTGAASPAIFCNTSLTVHGAVRGGDVGIEALSVSGGSATVRGDIIPGNAASPAIIAAGAAQLRVSGDIWCGGMASSSAPYGYFPIQGAFRCIDGEDLTIHLYDDSVFPTNAASNVELFTLNGGVPTEGVIWPSGVNHG